ncbi:OmpL47-type beta-barrel domain-containing protein [Paenibacillus sp. GCM10023248]|uniref:OmpL47-type beta-barrel domain-containing protein n=1 Tax=unclassified Paenibacillus TaxID=185978 RepID=UPI00237880FB|nr:hypothetical protein [Paenibacillus sp. MAHUQ-63]MDD9269135.1 hypothetical protein [Paenibacillus sp. MAHUQ-63]
MRSWVLFVMSVFLCFCLSLNIAAAAPATLTAELDGTSGIVTISGNTGLPGEHAVTVQVRDPLKRLAYLDQGTSHVNGEFSFYFQADLSVSGTYSVSARGDTADAISTTTFVIAVQDTVAPVTTASVSPLDGQGGWYVTPPTVTLNAADNVSVTETVYRLNGGAWNLYTQPVTITGPNGTYPFEYKSVDQAGNEETIQSLTLKIDQEAPIGSVTLDKSTLWPANHKLVTVTADVYGFDAVSQIDSIVLTSITSNEMLQPGDIQGADYGTSDLQFALRADRLGGGSGEGAGRVYTITYTVTDRAGNSSAAVATVTVPHDQSGKIK